MSQMHISININGTISATDLAKIMPLITPYSDLPATTASALGQTVEELKADKPKDAAKPKADKPKAEEKAKEEPAAEPAGDAPTADDVREAAQAYVGANTREALIELLGEFGAANISALAEDKRAEFIARTK
jgi:hypothetical protein